MPPPPCLVLPSLSPRATGTQVQVFICCWYVYDVCPLFCHANLLYVLTDTAANVGGLAQCSPIPERRVWGLVRNHVTVRVNSGPAGNRRLTLAASCLSCFVKAANLPFVAVDSSDKQQRKWRIFRDRSKTRSWGGGRDFPWGMGSSHEDLCRLHVHLPPPANLGARLSVDQHYLWGQVSGFSFCSSWCFSSALMMINEHGTTSIPKKLFKLHPSNISGAIYPRKISPTTDSHYAIKSVMLHRSVLWESYQWTTCISKARFSCLVLAYCLTGLW